MAEASRSRTYRRRLATTTDGFEDRGNHRINMRFRIAGLKLGKNLRSNTLLQSLGLWLAAKDLRLCSYLATGTILR